MDIGFFNRKRNDRPKLTGIGMLSLKRKTPIEQQNEVKDIPVNSINFMTDDENSDDEESPIRNKNPPSVKNLLLATLSSDSADIPKNDNEDDCDITCCSLLENDDLVSNAEGSTERYKKTPSLFSDSEISNEFLNNSLNFPLNENNVDAVKKTSTVADTVVGAFTDQDLMSSRLSELRIQECSQNKIQKATSMLADTVSSSFTDQDLMFSRLSELRIHGHTQNNRVSIVADTVLGPFTDEDLAYSHSFVSDSALSTKASKNEQNLKQKMKDVITTDNDTDVDEETASELDDCNNEASDHDESSSEEEVISILDSDEELNFSADPPLYNESDSFVNCSTVGSKLSSKTSTLPDSINTFFNNPPPVKSDEITVSHTMIRDFRNNITGFDKILDAVETSIEDRFVRKNDLEDEEVIIDESVEISETSDTDLEINKQNTNHTSDTVATDKESTYKNDEEHDAVIESEDISTVNSKIENQSTQSDKEHRETLRIKGRIKLEINFKIYHSSSSNSSNNSSNKSTTSSEPSPPKDPPRKNNHDTRARSSPKATPSKKKDQPRSKLALGKAGPSSANKPAVFSENKLSTPVNKKKSLNVKLDLVEDSSYKTPLKDNDIEIDEGLEEMLNTLYGEEWKTPSLLQSCKSRKFQKAVRKSMALFNFGAFSRNLPKDLESTRISSPTQENIEKLHKKFDVKTVESDKKVQKTPKYHPICDTDTEDSGSDSFGDDFQVDETWNASCSDSNIDDYDKDIKKRTLKSKVIQKPPTFQKDPENVSRSKEKKLDELLDRFEYKKPQQIATPSNSLKTKRKLFTHSYYDLDKDESFEIVNEVENKENNVKSPNIWNQPFPFQNKKLEQVKNFDSGISSVLTPSTPKTVVKKILKPSTVERLKTASKVTENFQKDRFKNFGFLKSLDVTLNKSLCHPEALMYRENFKLKKQELTDKLYKLYNDKVFDNKLEVLVNWNKKLTHTAGRCNNSRRVGDRKSTIDLSEKVLTSADRLRCTLIHEMCHAATWIINGENGHGATWKSYAARAMYTFPELPKISTCHNYIIEYKYTYQCVKCKAKFNAHSKSKKVENIQCSICHSKIELFLNKKNKDGVVLSTPVRKASGFAKFVQVKYKEIKTSSLTHAQVMQKLGSEFSGLSVEEKGQY